MYNIYTMISYIYSSTHTLLNFIQDHILRVCRQTDTWQKCMHPNKAVIVSKLAISLDVLSMLIKHWTFSNLNNTPIITMKMIRHIKEDSHINKMLPKANRLSRYVSHDAIITWTIEPDIIFLSMLI